MCNYVKVEIQPEYDTFSSSPSSVSFLVEDTMTKLKFDTEDYDTRTIEFLNTDILKLAEIIMIANRDRVG